MTLETYTPDTRFATSEPAYTTEITIASGEDLAALTPLGQLTATGEFVEWAPGAADGSEVATRMTVAAVDATGGAVVTQAYKSGCFNTDLVVWGAATALQKSLAFAGTPISVQTAG
ncbi:Bacteriophage lambda head decoration protein D [Amphritea atlantica]|uniref:Bacteriophage lambda head decoration protein D n=1 Tax=Amphritea atlantica TaxID=355243 RepID=A0A1H9GGK8_9GAMM|nr:head decoration protein [Amphritea atlantica]SEQ48988.1 Bacteriophage lambda head decoration protein D [Amphritea atlantica]